MSDLKNYDKPELHDSFADVLDTLRANIQRAASGMLNGAAPWRTCLQFNRNAKLWQEFDGAAWVTIDISGHLGDYALAQDVDEQLDALREYGNETYFKKAGGEISGAVHVKAGLTANVFAAGAATHGTANPFFNIRHTDGTLRYYLTSDDNALVINATNDDGSHRNWIARFWRTNGGVEASGQIFALGGVQVRDIAVSSWFQYFTRAGDGAHFGGMVLDADGFTILSTKEGGWRSLKLADNNELYWNGQRLHHDGNYAPPTQVPVGGIILWPGPTIPGGFFPCNGMWVSQSQYPALSAAIGGTYGWDGGDQIALPDLRGLFVRGLDQGRGQDADAWRALGSFQDQMFQSHNHQQADMPLGSANQGGIGYTNTLARGQHWTQNTGGAETRPRNLAMHYIIRAI